MRWLAVASLALASLSAHASESVITIPTRDGVTESYLLLAADDAPKKVVAVTFVGGKGLIRLARRAERGTTKRKIADSRAPISEESRSNERS
jgi:hypothetical protein